MKKILSKFKNAIIIDPYLYEYYNKTLSSFFDVLSEFLDRCINNGQNIQGIKELYHHIDNLRSELNLYSGVKGGLKFEGNFYARLKNLKFSKKMSKE